MFGFFKTNPRKKLDKEYYYLLEKAMQAQRSGDMRLYAELSKQAEAIQEKIEALEKKALV